MTTIPNARTDTRLSYWRKVLQKFQNQPGADGRNNVNFNAGLRRIQINVLNAAAGSRNPYLKLPLRMVEATLLRAIIKQ